MKMIFIYYPSCSTCKKALKTLKEHDAIVEIRHIVEDTPTAEELKAWIMQSGEPFTKFFNTHGVLYKEMGLKERVKNMNIEEAVALLAGNGMLIKRPLLITEEKVLVGFKEDDYKQLLK
ncbi:arsenate reductase family protein [Cellulosilyticum sp. ST5]|nr:arsenate reductase family protein [Cellulosilyticum sp. WCF-2]QEH69681.1 arsenate reductase family protein [Cellulosilyticum sp. WCF-2]